MRRGLRPLPVLLASLLAAAPAAAQVPAAPQVLPGITSREDRAQAVWILRAGLNVAALQCQFSPFLMTVPNYNAFLRQHSDEMADAFKAMTGYFVRTKGAKLGQRAFDTYATRTNQNWATFDAQLSFCEAAAMVGRRGLAVPKGKLGEFAAAELPAMRESLNGRYESVALRPRLEWAVVPPLTDPCEGRARCR